MSFLMFLRVFMASILCFFLSNVLNAAPKRGQKNCPEAFTEQEDKRTKAEKERELVLIYDLINRNIRATIARLHFSKYKENNWLRFLINGKETSTRDPFKRMGLRLFYFRFRLMKYLEIKEPGIDSFVSQLGDVPRGFRSARGLANYIKKIEAGDEEALKNERLLKSYLHAVRDHFNVEEQLLKMHYIALNGIDYLLTWNCRHIANANTRRSIELVLQNMGYVCPIICTPLELLGEHSDF